MVEEEEIQESGEAPLQINYELNDELLEEDEENKKDLSANDSQKQPPSTDVDALNEDAETDEIFKIPEEIYTEDDYDTVSWMNSQVLKKQLFARRQALKGNRTEIMERLILYNRNVSRRREAERTKSRERYTFFITVDKFKCTRLVSVPNDANLSDLVYFVLRCLNFDTDLDYFVDVANTRSECEPEAEINELDLVVGDVLELTYDGRWLISLCLLYDSELDMRKGILLIKATGESPNQITNRPEEEQTFPKRPRGLKKKKKVQQTKKRKFLVESSDEDYEPEESD
ncbi:hypothetical protein AKO1_008085 [Acrasis kona]|uniref:Uncharacterized protein n=1 Tax=Acrasis kona TaxID=1008807 RepID=A0AAW2YP46_9EUKA